MDTVVGVAETMANLAGDAIDAASKFVEDVKHACEEVASAVVAGVVAIKEAWDNLDPGLKQWLLLKASIAISMIPGVGIAGILIGCMLDGTFTDMFTAIRTGDGAMLGLCALSFVPGGKALKGLKAVGTLGKTEKLVGKMGKYGELKALTKGKSGLEVHHLAEKRFAGALGVKEKDIPCMIVQKGEHYGKCTSKFKEAIPYGSNYRSIGN